MSCILYLEAASDILDNFEILRVGIITKTNTTTINFVQNKS